MPDDSPQFGWLALLSEAAEAANAVTDAHTGAAAGYLLLAMARSKPHPDAVRVEPQLFGAGPELAVSLVLPPRGARPLFDDPAVVEAMRAVLRRPGRAPVFSTLVQGSTHLAGAISGVPASVVQLQPEWWAEDPFARLNAPQHRLLVPAGVLCPTPLPAGPGHQRHAGSPWPWGRFENAGARHV